MVKRLTSLIIRDAWSATLIGDLRSCKSRSGAMRTSIAAGRSTKTDCSKTRVKSKPSRQAASTTGPKAASAVGAQRGVEDVFMMKQDIDFTRVQKKKDEDEGNRGDRREGG